MKWESVEKVFAAVLLAYGAAVWIAGGGSNLFFPVWFVLSGLLFLTAFLSRKKDSRSTVLKRILRLFWTIFCIVIAVTWSLIGTQFRAQGSENLNEVIVPGSLVHENGPAKATAYRLDAAYDYLAKHPDTICIVSGGKGWNEPCAEAVIMKQYLVDRGIDESRILEEDRSSNTAENIAFSKEIIEEKYGPVSAQNVGIVTSNFHVYRGVKLAEHAGFAYVFGIAAETEPLFLANNMLRESCGILKDFVCGNL